MKLHVFSDVHLEFYWRSPMEVVTFFARLEAKALKDQVDTAIVAGDFCAGASEYRDIFTKGVESLCKIYDTVYFVPGNHEYWGTSLDELDDFLVQQAKLSVKRKLGKFVPLLCTSKKKAGLSVGGGTLWYSRDAGTRFIDFSRIIGAEEDIPVAHEKFLQLPLHSLDIVVSHHFPTEESIAPEWKSALSNDFFCARIEEHLEALSSQPKLWVHGHTHSPHDYMSRYGFRVYCNPYAYPGENTNPKFWDRLLVDVDFDV